MNWWNKKKVLILVFVGLLLIIGIVLIGITLVGPMFGCTFIGCTGGLDITLIDLPASDYQISVIFPSGKTQTLTCNPGIDIQFVLDTSCLTDGAFFSLSPDVAPPKKVTVIVIVEGKTFSQVFSPNYSKNQPNGRYCPPTCYGATLEMRITP
jgi:hypothetical protein